MKYHPRVLGVVSITHYPTLVFSSERATEVTLHPGDYTLLYPHWYQVSAQSSLQLVGKTAISAHQAAFTNVGGWKRDLESVLKGPLDCCLEARQADMPYVVFLDPDRMSWQEETPASFPPDAYVYLEPFFYSTDTLGRLHARTSAAFAPNQRDNSGCVNHPHYSRWPGRGGSSEQSRAPRTRGNPSVARRG